MHPYRTSLMHLAKEPGTHELAVVPLTINRPGNSARNAGVLVLDIQSDRMFMRILDKWHDEEISEVLSGMTADLRALAELHGGRVVLDYVQNTLSNVVQAGNSEVVTFEGNPEAFADQFFAARIVKTRPATTVQNVLIVEDNPSDVMLIEEVVKGHAPLMSMTVARDGEQALKVIDAGRKIDLVLLDLNLPKIDGHHVLRHMREDPLMKTTPVAIMTSACGPEVIAKAYRDGANWFIEKTMDIDVFAQRVSELCNQVLAA